MMSTSTTRVRVMERQRPSLESHEEAFRAVLANGPILNAYLRAIVRNPHLLEDTLSDVALAIARSWPNYDKARPFGPWARSIARRVAIENLTKHGIRPKGRALS